MSFKTSDVSAATALIIHGYLRAGGEEGIRNALDAIQQELFDWREELDGPYAEDLAALPPNEVLTLINGPRTPFNLQSAIISLAQELSDLSGVEEVELALNKARTNIG